MDDITRSLMVLIFSAVVVGGILLLSRRARKARERAIAAYCETNGWRLTVTNGPTARETVVESDDWRLVSGMHALMNTAQSGSSDWKRETEWVYTKPNPMRQTFALQLFAGSTDFDRLPGWVRESALSALRSYLGEFAANLASVRIAFSERGTSGIVLETEPRAADAALEALRVPLTNWRGGLPMYLTCSPEHIRVFLPDFVLQSAEQLDMLLSICRSIW